MKITLYVQPNAKRTEIAGKYGEYIKVVVKAHPVEGRANAALISFAAETLGLSKSEVSIISGQSSRLKTIAFDETKASEEGIAKLLNPLSPV